MDEQQDSPHAPGIAIVALTGRFPGAKDLEAYWRNLRDGVESISFFTDEQLQAEGVPPELLKQPSYVKARGVVDDIEYFDAGFFGYSPKDALLMDPQQRLFLECAWEGLELAGYDPRTYRGLIGVYGGSTHSSYGQLLYAGIPASQLDGMAFAIGNELSFLATRVSYKLDLRGPSFPVQTACSTSLVAVHLACQGLLNLECDMALAGGVSLRLPQINGYWYQEEGIFSSDGRCRPFDAKSQGTLFSNGVGLVVLKRLDDAIADGDTIHAVIRGSAVNNDGSRRASFTAPGVVGQTNVVADALAASEVDPETVSYIEAHGTATALGDSIEMQALTKAFGGASAKKQYCAIGSVKANLGHLDAAAGIAGMIKTVLAMQHRQLPPTLHFEKPNPDIRFEQTPFYVNDRLTDWRVPDGQPRRAGVSSFGFGGTNAHVVLEEAPELEPSGPSRPWQLLTLSAESETGLETATANLVDYFGRHRELDFADAAYTLKVGRRAFRNRRIAVCRSAEEAMRVLESRDAKFVFTGMHDGAERPVVFLFPGQGAQYVEMAGELYRDEPVFRDAMDECAKDLRPHLGFDLREVLYPADGPTQEHTRRLTQTAVAQPALFAVEYSLAKLWMSWGVQPEACIGHSIGEYVAACVAGVLSLADALRLVALRGKLMQDMPAGVMLAVPLPEARVRRLLGEGLWLAAVNAPTLCVVSGTATAIDALERKLQDEGVQSQRLQTSHAFHSGMMDPVVAPLAKAFGEVKLSAPKIPYISNATGTWITETQAKDPQYWARQMREAVLFAAGVSELLKNDQRLFLEVGPGYTLGTLVRRQAGARGARDVFSSLHHAQEQASDFSTTLLALGRLWLGGAAVDWTAFYEGEQRRRVPLPTYAFDKQRYWPPRGRAAAAKLHKPTGRTPRVDDWFYAPSWTQAPLPMRIGKPDPAAPGATIIFTDELGVGAALAARLSARGEEVVTIASGDAYQQIDRHAFTIDSSSAADHERLIAELLAQGITPSAVVHALGVSPDPDPSEPLEYERDEQRVFRSVLAVTRALGQADIDSPVRIAVLTTGMQEVAGTERLSPGKAIVLGLCHVIPQEYPNLSSKSIDLDDVHALIGGSAAAADALLHDLLVDAVAPVVAYRGSRRWVQSFRQLRLPEPPAVPARLRERGVYVITGGLGDIALNFGEYLARTVKARLVLTGRSAMPAELEWDRYLASSAPGDLVAQRIQRVRGIRALGGEVLILQADAADARQTGDALRAAEARFGRIDGIIHAAGLIAGDAFRPISETDDDVCRRQFQPKVAGLAALDSAIGDRDLDFVLLVSSLSSILGGLRYAAYASANLFLDAVAYRRNRTSRYPWITINWDAWLRAEDEARLKQANAPVTGFVMTGTEGVSALHRILSTDAGTQVIVSTGDLQHRVDQWLTVAAAEAKAPAPEEETIKAPRPNLQTEFVAPSDDLERAIAKIWQELLGVERVGVNDNFFELGGDSLLGIQVISRLKKELGVKVSAVTLYEGPRVSLLANIIRSNEQEQQPAAVEGSRERGEKRRERKLRHEAATQVLGA